MHLLTSYPLRLGLSSVGDFGVFGGPRLLGTGGANQAQIWNASSYVATACNTGNKLLSFRFNKYVHFLSLPGVAAETDGHGLSNSSRLRRRKTPWTAVSVPFTCGVIEIALFDYCFMVNRFLKLGFHQLVVRHRCEGIAPDHRHANRDTSQR